MPASKGVFHSGVSRQHLEAIVTLGTSNIRWSANLNSTSSAQMAERLSVPDFVMNEVKKYMSKLYDLKDTDRVFPFTKSYINNAMARACKKSGVKKIRIHDIRHSHASYLINLGCAPLLISERLGHEKAQTTLSTYSHLYPNKPQEVVDMIQNQHKKDMATSDVTALAEASEELKPQGTWFKVVSPKNKISPQQVHENDLSPCVGYTGRT